MECPICKKEVPDDAPEFPFCTERCKLIDLGNWASGKYVIPASIKPEDEEDEAPELGNPGTGADDD